MGRAQTLLIIREGKLTPRSNTVCEVLISGDWAESQRLSPTIAMLLISLVESFWS